MSNPEIEAPALAVDDFCRSYGVGRTFTYQLLGEGRLEAKKAGKRTLITAESAKAWWNSLPSKTEAA